jgi:hypothetical protein
MTIIDSALSNLTPSLYGRFKAKSPLLFEKITSYVTSFESIGRSEKNLMSKLRTKFDSLETEISGYAFKSSHEYQLIEIRFFNCIRECSLQSV